MKTVQVKKPEQYGHTHTHARALHTCWYGTPVNCLSHTLRCSIASTACSGFCFREIINNNKTARNNNFFRRFVVVVIEMHKKWHSTFQYTNLLAANQLSFLHVKVVGWLDFFFDGAKKGRRHCQHEFFSILLIQFQWYSIHSFIHWFIYAICSCIFCAVADEAGWHCCYCNCCRRRYAA